MPIEEFDDLFAYWRKAPPVNEIAMQVFRKDGDASPAPFASDEDFARALGATPMRKAG